MSKGTVKNSSAGDVFGGESAVYSSESAVSWQSIETVNYFSGLAMLFMLVQIILVL